MFAGLSEHGLTKYANIHRTKGDFKGEAAIDLLSYATVEYMACEKMVVVSAQK